MSDTYTVAEAKELAFKCWMEALEVDWQCIPAGNYPVEFLRFWDKITQ